MGRADLRNVLTLLVCAGILLAAGGCDPATGPERIAVVGSVTTESGGPVDGMISFLPESGTRGPAATASLIGGDFTFDRKTGPVAGSVRSSSEPRSDFASDWFSGPNCW